MFTLGGLALGVGRLVDDSIVELENIHRHLGLGQPRREAVLAAAQEVAMPILVSTITTIVVFLPVLFLAGVARNLFMPLALTIAFALTMSFFVSRTVTPLLSLYALKGHLGEAERGLPGAISRALTRVDHAYGRSLGWVLRHARRRRTRCSARDQSGSSAPSSFRSARASSPSASAPSDANSAPSRSPRRQAAATGLIRKASGRRHIIPIGLPGGRGVLREH